MKTPEHFRITAVRLVEFHNLGTTTVELPEGGHLFLLGDNGSGKTTLLDAIHLVLTAGREMEFNSAARVAGAKDSGGRTYQGVVLRYNAVTGRTYRSAMSFAICWISASGTSRRLFRYEPADRIFGTGSVQRAGTACTRRPDFDFRGSTGGAAHRFAARDGVPGLAFAALAYARQSPGE